MDAAAVNASGDDGSPGRAGYRRSAGSPRGEARRRELLGRVTDDLAVNGLVDLLHGLMMDESLWDEVIADGSSGSSSTHPSRSGRAA